jgi:hypothetical protein
MVCVPAATPSKAHCPLASVTWVTLFIVIEAPSIIPPAAKSKAVISTSPKAVGVTVGVTVGETVGDEVGDAPPPSSDPPLQLTITSGINNKHRAINRIDLKFTFFKIVFPFFINIAPDCCYFLSAINPLQIFEYFFAKAPDIALLPEISPEPLFNRSPCYSMF